MKLFIFLSILSVLSGCANIVKSPKQQVKFANGPIDSEATVITPDGQVRILNGQGTLLMTRSRPDIPITIMCKGENQNAVLNTRFDILFGGFGNLLFGGLIGWVVDPLSNTAYDIPSPVDLAPYCAGARQPAEAKSPGK